MNQREAVVFAIGPQIFYWRHDLKVPQKIAERPQDVTALCFAGNTLLDGSFDGNVRETLSGEVRFSYDAPVIGVSEVASGDGYNGGRSNDGYLLGKIAKDFSINLFGVSGNPILVTTNNGTTSFWLDDRILAFVESCRTGKSQTLATYSQFFWTTDGAIYRGFNRSQKIKRFMQDHARLVPYNYLGDFAFMWHTNNRVENLEILQDRENRIIWSHDFREDGYSYFAGFYQWQRKNAVHNEPYFMVAYENYRRREQGSGLRYYYHIGILPTSSFSKRVKPRTILQVDLEHEPRYGETNPFIAHESLMTLIK